MAEGKVAEAELVHGVEKAVEFGDGPEMSFGFGDGHFEDLCDGFSFVSDLQSLAIEAFAEAGGAFRPCVGQEMHFDLELAVALAALAAAALRVEGETGFGVAALFGDWKLCEEVADQIESADKSRGVRARGAADGGLVAEHEFLNVLHAGDSVVLAGCFRGVVEMAGEGLGEDAVDQGRFATTRRTGDYDDLAEGDGDGEVLEVMLARALDGKSGLWFLVSGFWSKATNLSAQPLAGGGADFRRLSLREDFSALETRAGTHVDEVVGGADDVFVVFYYDYRISKIAEADHCGDEAGGVGGMEADGRLVEDVDHAAQAGTELGGELDALDFAAGEGAGGAVEREVIEADVLEEIEAFFDFGS